MTPLVQTVKRWWFEADAWRDPQAQRKFLARIDAHQDEGVACVRSGQAPAWFYIGPAAGKTGAWT